MSQTPKPTPMILPRDQGDTWKGGIQPDKPTSVPNVPPPPPPTNPKPPQKPDKKQQHHGFSCCKCRNALVVASYIASIKRLKETELPSGSHDLVTRREAMAQTRKRASQLTLD